MPRKFHPNMRKNLFTVQWLSTEQAAQGECGERLSPSLEIVQNHLDTGLCQVFWDDPAWVGKWDQMSHCSPTPNPQDKYTIIFIVPSWWQWFVVSLFVILSFSPLFTGAHGPRQAIHDSQPSGLPHFWNPPWADTAENGSYKAKTTLPKFSLITVRLIKILGWELNNWFHCNQITLKGLALWMNFNPHPHKATIM